MTHPPRNLQKRLWLTGGGIALFLLTLVVAGPLVDQAPGTGKLWLGHDFLPAYVAGQFVRTGEFQKMYDRDAFRAAQDRVVNEAGLELDKRYAATLNPPHFALLFAPLSALPYRTAAAVWLGINAVLFAASLVLLARMLPPKARRNWKSWGLVPLLATASMPFLQAAGHQQNTFLSLLILATTVTLWRAGRGFAAGAVAGLLFYKPQLAAVVALVLAADLGRRAVLGLGVTGTFLLLLTVIAMPGALPEYCRSLPSNLDFIQNQQPYPWARQATLLGFARQVLQGDTLGAPSRAARALWLAGASVGLAALAATFIQTHRAQKQTPKATLPRDRLIAATIAATPLLLPYYLDYDLLLLSVPAVLFAAEHLCAREWTRADRWTLRAWVGLYLWLYANPASSGMMRVSLTAPLLAAVTTGLVVRALRLNRVSPTAVEESAPTTAARAADPPAAMAA
jgi:hypothetical protein